jgi:hypothetical protein
VSIDIRMRRSKSKHISISHLHGTDKTSLAPKEFQQITPSMRCEERGRGQRWQAQRQGNADVLPRQESYYEERRGGIRMAPGCRAVRGWWPVLMDAALG